MRPATDPAIAAQPFAADMAPLTPAEELSAMHADMTWLGGYLAANYPIGRPDACGRICIGGGCGATWKEAVRAGRELHERMRAAYLERLAKGEQP